LGQAMIKGWFQLSATARDFLSLNCEHLSSD